MWSGLDTVIPGKSKINSSSTLTSNKSSPQTNWPSLDLKQKWGFKKNRRAHELTFLSSFPNILQSYQVLLLKSSSTRSSLPRFFISVWWGTEEEETWLTVYHSSFTAASLLLFSTRWLSHSTKICTKFFFFFPPKLLLIHNFRICGIRVPYLNYNISCH